MARARLADRNRAIWKLHLGGWPQERIADRYGLSQSQVSRIITATRRAIPAQERADLIQTEIARLDAVLTSCWQIMERGTPGAVLGAVDRILAISRERRRLLGLDAPKRAEHSGPQGGPIPVDATELSPDQVRRRALQLAEEVARAYEDYEEDG